MAVQVVEFASLFNDEIARFFDVLSKAFLKYHFFILVSSKKTKNKSKLLNCKNSYNFGKYK